MSSFTSPERKVLLKATPVGILIESTAEALSWFEYCWTEVYPVQHKPGFFQLILLQFLFVPEEMSLRGNLAVFLCFEEKPSRW